MATIPIIETNRLVLRPFRSEDAPEVARILSTPHMFQHTLPFEQPYPVQTAVSWIGRHAEDAARGVKLQWAITLPDNSLIGTVSLALERDPPQGDLGYWIGVAHWNQGYATEAVRAVIAYGFEVLRLPRIEGMCYASNTASTRVLEKSGLVLERTLRDYIVVDGEPHDVLLYAIHPGDR
jgi:[ribosomal protein S5]-alanine N-acetyltransferase